MVSKCETAVGIRRRAELPRIIPRNILRFFVVSVSWVCNVYKYGMDRRYICQLPRAWFRLQVKRTHSNERASQLRPYPMLFRCRDSDLHYGKLHTFFFHCCCTGHVPRAFFHLFLLIVSTHCSCSRSLVSRPLCCSCSQSLFSLSNVQQLLSLSK